jgi:dihydroneopterin aldolase / 2-amino-4-hydroxy-6-hydroxymethyldihydropteridine diphosphokinase / dihydropteroate synthase
MGETCFQSLESLSTLVSGVASHESFPLVTARIRKPAVLFASAAGVQLTRPLLPLSQGNDRDIFLALGSNLGDRLGYLDAALRSLNRANIFVQDISGLYESEPMYLREQPFFLNAVCKVQALSSKLMAGSHVRDRS